MSRSITFHKMDFDGEQFVEAGPLRVDGMPPGLAVIDRCSTCEKTFSDVVPPDGVLILGDDYCDECYIEMCQELGVNGYD